MHAFSAADLISPAIKRTKWFLFQPFRWSTFLKLCLVSVLTEGGSSSNFNFPGGNHSGHHSSSPVIPTLGSPYFGLSPLEIALIAAVLTVFIGLCLVIFYLVTRLRFALFHCLVYQTREIRPGWRLYESQSWRFFLLSIAVGLGFLFAMSLIALPFILGFYRIFRSSQAGVPFDTAAFIALLLPIIPIVLILVLVGIAIHIVLQDLMLPHMALENASAGAAWQEARRRIVAEKGGFAIYALLRVAMRIAAAVVAFVALIIPVFTVVVVVGLPTAGLMSLLATASGVGKLLLVLLMVAIVTAGVAAIVLLALCLGGPIGIGIRNFALLFYGGRYQVLGDLLSPPPPTPIIESSPETA